MSLYIRHNKNFIPTAFKSFYHINYFLCNTNAEQSVECRAAYFEINYNSRHQARPSEGCQLEKKEESSFAPWSGLFVKQMISFSKKVREMKMNYINKFIYFCQDPNKYNGRVVLVIYRNRKYKGPAVFVTFILKRRKSET